MKEWRGRIERRRIRSRIRRRNRRKRWKRENGDAESVGGVCAIAVCEH